MRYLSILIFIISFNSLSKSITIIPLLPDGYSFFEKFQPKSELETNAFLAVEKLLANNNDAPWNYYLSNSKLDVAQAMYKFKVKHSSVFTKKPYVKSYLNGTFVYDIKEKSVRFVRDSQLNKPIKQD